jgi:hypothetical protein
MAGQPFKLANGSAGLTTFTPTVGTAILTANEADLCAVGASGEIIAPHRRYGVRGRRNRQRHDHHNLTEGVTGVVLGIDMYNQRYQGAIKGFTDGGTVVATNIISENPDNNDLIFMSGAFAMLTAAGM